MLSEREIVG